MRHLTCIAAAAATILSACVAAEPGIGPAPAGAVSSDRGTAAVFTPELIERVERMMKQEYPQLLEDAGVAGEVVVRFTIREDGRTGNVDVVSSTQEMFGASTRRIVSRLDFGPAAATGRVAPTRVEGVLRFSQHRANEATFRLVPTPGSR